jgi:hypothetical protein
MEPTGRARILVVADKTAATPELIEAVRARAARGPVRFHLLVPNPDVGGWHPSDVRHPDLTHGQNVLALALPLLQEASCSTVEGSVSVRHDPMDAVEEALFASSYDEVIVSTLPHHLSVWLHMDLPSRVAKISGLPVMTVTAQATGVVASR